MCRKVQLKNAIYDNVTATVNGLGDVTLNEDSKEVAAANVSVNDMVAIGMMSWRVEMNDMNKRMGELRNANGEHGVWVVWFVAKASTTALKTNTTNINSRWSRRC